MQMSALAGARPIVKVNWAPLAARKQMQWRARMQMQMGANGTRARQINARGPRAAGRAPRLVARPAARNKSAPERIWLARARASCTPAPPLGARPAPLATGRNTLTFCLL